MTIFKALQVAILLATISSSCGFAEMLTVNGGTPVVPGASGVVVDINIDDGSNVAGASFIVTYDKTKLTLTGVSSSFFDTFASKNIFPVSVTLGTKTYTQGLVYNPTNNGVALTGVRASKGASGQQTLFTLTFDIAATAIGDYPIKIVNTVIQNAAAGYPAATVLPMLVGIDSTTNPVSFPAFPAITTSGFLVVGSSDTDGDGLTNYDERNMGSDPYSADSDGDGLNDGEEFIYWGSNWNADTDMDGRINLLDHDADNDGYLDGDEVAWNSSPDDAGSKPIHVYEDAEDGTTNGWTITDVDPVGATVSNVFDAVRASRVIEVTGDGVKDQFILKKDNGYNWNDADFKVIQWSMKYGQTFTVIIVVATRNGTRYLQYQPIDTDKLLTGTTIHHGLGSQIKDGTWHTVARDLNYDINEAEPGNELLKVLQFRIRGSGRLDDILTSAAIPETQDSDADTITDNEEIYTYGTHPYHADSDGDGLDDGDEFAFWGNDWNLDPDMDGLMNILDGDADNDGYLDGREVSAGTEPGNSLSFPHVYEDAEDGTTNGWTITDVDPVGATVSNVFDAVRASRVIEVTGDGVKDQFILKKDNGSNWNDADFKVIQWSMNYGQTFTVSIVVETRNGTRSLQYQPIDTDNLLTGTIIHHGLGSQIKDGNWHTVARDLDHDINEAEPGNELLKVLHFRIKGSGRLDDIRTIGIVPANP